MLMVMLQAMEYRAASEHHRLEELLGQLAAGKQGAMEELYQRTRAAVYAMVLSILKNAHDAQGEDKNTRKDMGSNAALSAALSHAELSKEQIGNLEVERDEDDGRLEYEIKFKSGKMEYEYTIDACTGAVLEHEQDWDD